MAALAPMPSASVRTTAITSPGVRVSEWSANLKSRSIEILYPILIDRGQTGRFLRLFFWPVRPKDWIGGLGGSGLLMSCQALQPPGFAVHVPPRKSVARFPFD